MPKLRCGVLGALEVHVDGQARHIPPGRQRGVLTCLLVHEGRPVAADSLIEAAWGPDLPHDPPGALRTVVSRLRAHLGQHTIELGPAGYRLAAGTLDAVQFVALLERSRTAEPTAARELLRRALGLWRGPAYGEYADAPFATAAAERLEQLRSDAEEDLAAQLIRTGEPTAAVPALEHLLAGQPFRERAVELLGAAFYHSGRQTQALQTLRDYQALLRSELGLDPSPALVELEGRILGHDLAPPAARRSGPPGWLATTAAFIGREDELADLAEAVAANPVTVLTGPGGVGKSRLAAESLATLHERPGLPIAVAELAPVAPGRIGPVLADALGLRASTSPEPTTVVDELVEFLTAVPHLLVLDSCEHLLDEVRELVVDLTHRCPLVRVLATSRRRLGLAGELQIRVHPLRLPDPTAPASAQGLVGSVRLFADRVRRLQPTFTLTTDNTSQVAQLCHRCDGLPLALELAAARTATSSVAETLAQMDPERLRTDEQGLSPARPGQDAGARSGLGAVVAWSYGLLAPDERALLDHLSLFTGEFAADDVHGLVAHLPSWDGDVASALVELVESSLVTHHLSGTGARYRLLEMVRAFAASQLEGSGQASHARLAHGAWVRDVVDGIQADWSRVDGAELSARLSVCAAEVGRALRWALDAGQLELASEISHAVVRCWHWTPAPLLRDLMLEVAERGVQHPGPHVAAGTAAGAFSAAERGDTGRAAGLGTAALAMSQDARSAATARLALAVAAMYTGDHDRSVRWFQEAAAEPGLIGEANSSLALLACYADDLGRAREHAAVALAVGGTGGDHSLAFARYALGEVEARTDPVGGAALLRQAAAEADRVDAEQVSRVARIALFALLVRGGGRGEAVELGLRLVGDLRRLSAWNQVWTLLRILAELLADIGRWSDAAYLLGAAQGAPSAPPAVGADVDRYAVLQAGLCEELGARVVEQIQVLAVSIPRAQVLTRAERLLEDLRDDPPQ